MNKEEFKNRLKELVRLHYDYKLVLDDYNKSIRKENNNLANKFKKLFSDKLECNWKNDISLDVNYDGIEDLITINVKLIECIPWRLTIWIKGKEELIYRIKYGKNTKYNDHTDLSKLLLIVLNDEEGFILKTNDFIDESNLRVLYDKQNQYGTKFYNSVSDFTKQFTFPLSEKEIEDYNDVLTVYDSNINDCDNEFRLRTRILNIIDYAYNY